MYFLLLCRSLTYAQRAEKQLERKGISASLVKAPKDIADKGCAYCLRVNPRQKDKALSVLRDSGLEPMTVYEYRDGLITEVLS